MHVGTLSVSTQKQPALQRARLQIDGALFLDWSKAFDSVTFTAIHAAMEHAGVPAHTRKLIMALYNNPTFVARDSSQKSLHQTQTKGLRQGCPVSPWFRAYTPLLRCRAKISEFLW